MILQKLEKSKVLASLKICALGLLIGVLGYLLYAYTLSLHTVKTLHVLKKSDFMTENATQNAENEPLTTQNGNSTDPVGAGSEDLFVASSRGTYFYPINCSKGQALAVKNRLYFKDKMSAEAAGYKEYSGC